MSRAATMPREVRVPGEAAPPAPLERPVPYDVPAEEAVLGSLLLDRDAIIKTAPLRLETLFFSEPHRWIYETILDLYNRAEPPDLITLSSALDRRGVLDKIGGVAYLAHLMRAVPTAIHVEYYARIVFEQGIRRGLIRTGGQIAGLGYEEGVPLESVLLQADTLLSALRQLAVQRQIRSAQSLLSAVSDMVGTGYGAPGGVWGLRTGLADLDALLGGLHKRQLITVAARPSVGKSSLGGTIVYNLAVRPLLHGQPPTPVAVASFETDATEYLLRLVALHVGASMRDIRLGLLTDAQTQRLSEALEVIYAAPIYFDGDEETGDDDMSIATMRQRMRRMRAETGAELIVVDYLQLMSGPGRDRDNRVREMTHITRGMKQMARELNVAVLVLSQLSREIEKRASHIPVLSDLRESGSIEQDSDVVVFIHRPEMYDPDDRPGLAEFHIAKSRNGEAGRVAARFQGATTSFHDLLPDEYQRYGS